MFVTISEPADSIRRVGSDIYRVEILLFFLNFKAVGNDVRGKINFYGFFMVKYFCNKINAIFLNGSVKCFPSMLIFKIHISKFKGFNLHL